MRQPVLFCVFSVLTNIAALSEVSADEPVSTNQEVAASSDLMGAIEGTVFYRIGSKRSWRYARYYIKDSKQGQLAEAVVALKSRTLEKRERLEDPATVVIDQKDFRFIPETVAIRAGDRIKFTNSDKQVHNIKTLHPKLTFNRNMPPGGEHIETFRQAGGMRRPYQIGCVYHSSMRAWVFVLDHPYFEVTSADGSFRLKDVPVGRYDLEMVHPAGQLRWTKTVNVQPNKTTRIEIRVSADNRSNRRS